MKFTLTPEQSAALIRAILEYHREQFPFESGVESENRDKFYELAGFLNAFFELK